MWQLIVQESSFTYATDKLYCLDTGFIMVGKNLKYLIALLNSKPIDTFFRKYYVGNTLGRNGYKYSKVSIEQLPIPKISEIEQKPFIELVDKILAITNPPSSPFNKRGTRGKLFNQFYQASKSQRIRTPN